MKAFQLSKDHESTLEEKLEKLDTYTTGDLLYVVREYEDAPYKFEDEVVKKLSILLYNKGIILM